MRAWLAAVALLWPALLSTAAIERIRGEVPALTAAIYIVAGRICHQRPERSFHTDDVAWPVCARCTGLYFAAAVGAVVAMTGRGVNASGRRMRSVLAVAALPTAITFGLEWGGRVPVGNLARAIAALPLGAALAWAVVSVAPRGAEANQVN